jgi:hypothetical protein
LAAQQSDAPDVISNPAGGVTELIELTSYFSSDPLQH